MKIIAYLLSGLILALSACKESKKIVGEPMTGTPISLKMPSGFYREGDKNLFIHNVYDANILVSSYPVPYDTALLQYRKERFDQGVTRKLISGEAVKINGVNGMLYQASLNQEGYNFKRWQLVLPEGSGTLTVVGSFPIDQEKELSTPIKEMLLNAYVDTDWKPDMSQLDFTVQPAGSLKLAKMLDGPSVMYTADGEWINRSILDCSFLCGATTASHIDNLTKYTEMTFKKVCPKCEIDWQDTLTVDGLKAREIWGTEQDSLVTRLKYEAIVFDSLKCYYLIGTAEKDNEARLGEFKSSVRTLKKKDKKNASI
jgi:hypothetical protein